MTICELIIKTIKTFLLKHIIHTRNTFEVEEILYLNKALVENLFLLKFERRLLCKLFLLKLSKMYLKLYI